MPDHTQNLDARGVSLQGIFVTRDHLIHTIALWNQEPSVSSENPSKHRETNALSSMHGWVSSSLWYLLLCLGLIEVI